jgi:hypothetical protein
MKMSSATIAFLETKTFAVNQSNLVTKRAFIDEAFIKTLHADVVTSTTAEEATAGNLQDAMNVGNGEGAVFKEVVNDGETLVFKRLEAGSNATITDNTDTITISATASGTGDVVGPAGANDGGIALFSGTTGKVIKDSKVNVDDNGILLQFTSTPTQTRLSDYATLQTTVTWTAPGGDTKITNVYFQRLNDRVRAFIWGDDPPGPPVWTILSTSTGNLETLPGSIPVGFRPRVTQSIGFADGTSGITLPLQLFATNGDPSSLTPAPPSFAFAVRRVTNLAVFIAGTTFQSLAVWSICYLAA